MRADMARRIVAWDEAHLRLQRAMHGRATEEAKAWLRAEAEALSPLVEEARRELEPVDEPDVDKAREAVRETLWAG